VYELFDHTADVGLRVAAPSLDALFAEAACGFFSIVVEPAPRREGMRRVEFALEAERLEFLLVDWLNELLFTFDTKRLVLDRFEVRVEGTRLTAAARARPLDERDRVLVEVKAVTYHGLRVERTPDGWQAELILDI